MSRSNRRVVIRLWKPSERRRDRARRLLLRGCGKDARLCGIEGGASACNWQANANELRTMEYDAIYPLRGAQMNRGSRLLGLSVCLAGLLHCGCDVPKLTTAKDAVGEYVFGYPSGEVEAVILLENLTYRQEFYSNQTSYLEYGDPKYCITNAWTHTASSVTMSHFLGFCEMDDPGRRIDPPEVYGSFSRRWIGPTHFGDAVIDIDVEQNHLLTRVKKRERAFFRPSAK